MTLDILIFCFLLLSNFMILSSIGATRTSIEQKLKRIEFRVDLIIDHLDFDRFPEELKEIALDPNPQQRLKAIHLYTQKTGASLKEAVEAVEKLSGQKIKS